MDGEVHDLGIKQIVESFELANGKPVSELATVTVATTPPPTSVPPVSTHSPSPSPSPISRYPSIALSHKSVTVTTRDNPVTVTTRDNPSYPDFATRKKDRHYSAPNIALEGPDKFATIDDGIDDRNDLTNEKEGAVLGGKKEVGETEWQTGMTAGSSRRDEDDVVMDDESLRKVQMCVLAIFTPPLTYTHTLSLFLSHTHTLSLSLSLSLFLSLFLSLYHTHTSFILNGYT